MDCLFCKIINEEIPSMTLYEDSILKVIMDVNPLADGHLLIIPRKHIEDFIEMDDTTLLHIYEVAKKMKNHLYGSLEPDGLKLIINYGSEQVIKHFHLHIVPVYKNKEVSRNIDNIYDKINKKINLSNLMN